ncbi:amidase [Nocardia stercoris]|uniref:amidase n=1 Tax=Nocardia stercoris TaxID=2483361 RepID=A0A3M2KUM5_9NOCA|nr:amidase family protein [Nocardia stercoris]RMI29362.1 amidase [Nocardia stercoris]
MYREHTTVTGPRTSDPARIEPAGTDHSGSQTATAVAAAVRDGLATPEQVTAAALLRITAANPKVNAFSVIRTEQATAEAAETAERLDLEALPLAGVPIAVKPTATAADSTIALQIADHHEVTRRLRAAGAVVVGLTEGSELDLWANTDSPAGITRSPANPRFGAGGASGGSAAAVAAGLVPIAHGTDNLGSLRIPAACCGVVGVKPGRGVVPSDIGVDSWDGLAENGVLARTVTDAALALSVLAARPALADLDPPAPLRIALVTESPYPAVRVDRSWRNAARLAGRAAAGAGHSVALAELPGTGLLPALVLRWLASAAREARRLPSGFRLQTRTRTHAALGNAVLRAGLIRPAQAERIENRMLNFFDDYDVVLSPTLATPPPARSWHDRSWAANVCDDLRRTPFTAVWNLIGWAAVSLPVGTHPRTGAPLAVQLAGPPGSEATLLRLAAQLEAARP